MTFSKQQFIHKSRTQLVFMLLLTTLFSSFATAEVQFSSATQQLQNGFYRAALSSYQQTLEDALQSKSPKQQQLAEAGIGHTLYLLNQPQQAASHLQTALSLSKQSPTAVDGQIHYYLALVQGQLKDKEAFDSHWKQAMSTAKQQSDSVLQAYLHLASIKWAVDVTSLNQHLQDLHLLLSSKNTNSENWGIIYLNTAEHLIQHRLLGSLQDSKNKKTRIYRSYDYLQQAKHYLPESALRPQATIAGLQGRLYEAEQRNQEALTFTKQALQLAQKASAQDLQMLYEWQSGRLYKKLAQPTAAIESYRRAMSHTEAIHQDIPVHYQDGKSSFKELLGPLYLDLADLVLQQAKDKQNQEKQTLLNEAQGLLEQLKQTELEDFFQDRCLTQSLHKYSLNEVSGDTAILYPVLLENRFEWLIGIKGQLHQIQIDQPGEEISQKIRQYTADLRNGRPNDTNQILYQQLFKPLEPLLKKQNIQTLVYIPDGVLRLLPLSVLSDGKQYVIERYAIATLPGLNLLNARTELKKSGKSLLVGLSQPTVEVVSQLPASLLTNLTKLPAENEQNNQQQLINKTRSAKAALANTSNKQNKHKKVQNKALSDLANALALPGVATEINQLAQSLPNLTLLDQKFTLNNFEKEVVLADYDIIHIASHGFFSGDSKDSFIMTYNKLLTIDKLENLLRGREKNAPINILTLSACQTAEGDDRAPMGLSGIAIKANAQTALGSLWPISDEAAVKLMTTFYHQLMVEHKSKAKALQIAQLQLINDPEMNDPLYWAPFILVGHWL